MGETSSVSGEDIGECIVTAIGNGEDTGVVLLFGAGLGGVGVAFATGSGTGVVVWGVGAEAGTVNLSRADSLFASKVALAVVVVVDASKVTGYIVADEGEGEGEGEVEVEGEREGEVERVDVLLGVGRDSFDTVSGVVVGSVKLFVKVESVRNCLIARGVSK